MHRATLRHLLTFVLVLAALAMAPAAAIAGGSHGSGDSSNNPFTGDSYAYFHGGQNAGRQAMILPGRHYGPPPSGYQLYPRNAPQASAPRDTRRFRPATPDTSSAPAVATPAPAAPQP
jgi:hypothetical protein